MNTTEWLITPSNSEVPVTIRLHQVDVLVYGEFTVPVWQVDPGQGGCGYYTGPFVRHADLPADLAARFSRWQLGAAIPFRGAAYDHDFRDFMASRPRD